MLKTWEVRAWIAMAVSLLLFAACICGAYVWPERLSMGLLITSHLMVVVSAGVFKVSAVVVMACRHKLRQAMA